jgi:hypothetical protein
MRASSIRTAICLVVALAFSASALAGKKAPKSKPPKGYPAGVPYLAGGKHDPKLSFDFTVTLRYKGTVKKIYDKLMKKLKAGKWRIEPDVIPGMKGERFVAYKGEMAIYFTIKPDYGNPDIIMIVTDTVAMRKKAQTK